MKRSLEATMQQNDGIRQAVRDWQVAWNSGDMRAAARLFCEDADFVNVRGSHWHTRNQIEAEHARRHQLQLKGSVFTATEINEQRIAEGFALVHIRWSITGDHELDGTRRPPRSGVMSWLMLREAEGPWRIRSAHNTHINPPPEE
jgi:uncharacterized protein (TIGR02246 family)